MLIKMLEIIFNILSYIFTYFFPHSCGKIIASASKSWVKRRALENWDPDAEYLAIHVPSGVSEQPTSKQETILGAKQRC